jgi:hypothetical protein
MGKINSFNYRYTIITRDSDERRITGLVSCHDIARTKILARSFLWANKAAFVDVYNYAPHEAFLENCKPVVRISLDGES